MGAANDKIMPKLHADILFLNQEVAKNELKDDSSYHN